MNDLANTSAKCGIGDASSKREGNVKVKKTRNDAPKSTELEKALPTAPKPGAVQKGEWSEEELDQFCERFKFPAAIRNELAQKATVVHFYRYYFNGILPSGCSANQVILPMIASLQCSREDGTTDFFFPNACFANQSFLSLPQAEGAVDLSDIKDYKAVDWTPAEGQNKADQRVFDLYYALQDTDTKMFRKSVIDIVKNWNTSTARQYASIDSELAPKESPPSDACLEKHGKEDLTYKVEYACVMYARKAWRGPAVFLLRIDYRQCQTAMTAVDSQTAATDVHEFDILLDGLIFHFHIRCVHLTSVCS
ncbi:hypothetical protein WN55_10564 [Dufourea novaeangliae]|uniref:Uncharacterized protein n=1 Tax=Dufourea novaeangliae TaxID=178035 RepID=A0A154P484_DUFNO|nr:hypothetical protein WN55_10564 [Dufourea novaeangliae]